MQLAHNMALQNHQIDRPVPLDQWADFRFQERAVTGLGRFRG
jgi:hypothetical protein